ncbi:hypothetical protein NEFER03_1097 [Nematocida sp. LUAm3]|nr:hypothetical protein NEFER03_1097 [Nematocida sp. LUAm3]KAI5175298.1 hypothetical protein NEFER02_1227 [Nematocida sp. LUAm2]KAI5177745.1 hypothetical protein NEFER01_0969 [Nematocida sp. LUAm1]
MDLVAENMRYIEMNLCKDLYQDHRNRVYIVPTREVEYSVLFKDIALSFNSFYSYVTSFQFRPQDPDVAHIVLYMKSTAKVAKLEEHIKGYKKLLHLVKEKTPCRIHKLLKNRETKESTIKESEIEKVLARTGMYMGNMNNSELYRGILMAAEYFLRKNMYQMAERYAREAQHIAGKFSNTKGLEKSNELLEEIQKFFTEKKRKEDFH